MTSVNAYGLKRGWQVRNDNIQEMDIQHHRIGQLHTSSVDNLCEYFPIYKTSYILHFYVRSTMNAQNHK